MEPQPPPNALPPPPSDLAKRSRRWWYGMIIFGVVSAVGLLGFADPWVIRSYRNLNWVAAISNARQIHLGLLEFEQEYGKFPDADTAELVRSRNVTTLAQGTKTSNDYFRQLLAANMGNEKMFYADIKGARRPDDLPDEAKALEKGECGFSYILGANLGSSMDRPVIVTPLIPGTLRFDPSRFDGKAIISRRDGSVSTFPINKKTGRVMISGKDLFDPSNTWWGGVGPVVVWPE